MGDCRHLDTDEQGRLIEHWDIIGEWVDETVSGHTQVDGPTEPTDLHKTEENKAVVAGFVTEVLKYGEFDKVSDYISAKTYVQHNPQVGEGIAGLGAFVTSLGDQGLSVAYQEVYKVVGCGDFVAVLSQVDLAAATWPSSTSSALTPA